LIERIDVLKAELARTKLDLADLKQRQGFRCKKHLSCKACIAQQRQSQLIRRSSDRISRGT